MNLNDIPIIGQKKPDPYPMGGLVLAFPQAHPEIAGAWHSQIATGRIVPDMSFAMVWSHASVECQRLRLITMALANELAELKGETIPFPMDPVLPAAKDLLALEMKEETTNDDDTNNTEPS